MSDPKGSPTLDFAMIDMGDSGEIDITEDTVNHHQVQSNYDGETEHSTSRVNQAGWPFGPSNLQDNIQLASSMSNMVQRGKQAWTIYGNIDVLRPYFDVEPRDVTKRLLTSLIPVRPVSRQKVAKELYGPLMVIFTLIALLLFQMKSSRHTVEEGTLMGTAFGVCFMYWVGASSLIWFLSFVCACSITYIQTLSLMGYGLFSHCIVLLATTLIHTTHDHVFFYVMWGIVGGLATLRMVTVLMSRTTGRTQTLVICSVVAGLHLLYLLYLHFAYHQTVEEISEAIGNKLPEQVVVSRLAGANIALPDHLTNEPTVMAVARVTQLPMQVVTIATKGLGNQTAVQI